MFTVYIYRDIWPLATYDSDPKDRHDQSMLWYKIGLLAILTVVIPLSMPTQYVPINAKVREPLLSIHIYHLQV